MGLLSNSLVQQTQKALKLSHQLVVERSLRWHGQFCTSYLTSRHRWATPVLWGPRSWEFLSPVSRNSGPGEQQWKLLGEKTQVDYQEFIFIEALWWNTRTEHTVEILPAPWLLQAPLIAARSEIPFTRKQNRTPCNSFGWCFLEATGCHRKGGVCCILPQVPSDTGVEQRWQTATTAAEPS